MLADEGLTECCGKCNGSWYPDLTKTFSIHNLNLFWVWVGGFKLMEDNFWKTSMTGKHVVQAHTCIDFKVIIDVGGMNDDT